MKSQAPQVQQTGLCLPKGGSSFFLRSAPRKADGRAAHSFLAHPDAQAAIDAVVVFLRDPRVMDAQLCRHAFHRFGLRRARQEKLRDDAPCPNDTVRVREHADAVQGGVRTGGLNHGRPPRHMHFHDAEPAGAIGRQGLVVAKGRHLDPGLLDGREKLGPCRHFHGHTVNS